MGMIRNHLLQMKVEQPDEYKRLMGNHTSEDDCVREVLGLSLKAINYYVLKNGGTKNDKGRPNN